VKTLIPGWKKAKTAGRVEIDTDVAKIAIVGSRIASTPGLGARMFTALADRSINIDCISTSEMKVSCIIAEKSLDDGARAIHAEFFGQTVREEESSKQRGTAKTATRKNARKRVARA
jgi:aspartate kinase